MKALRGLGLAVISFLLFLSLSLFGLALTVNSTLLNRNFLPNQLDRLDVSALGAEILSTSNADLSPDMRDAVVRTVTKLEPQVKGQLRAANSQIYDYLLGKTNTLDLRSVLKSTVLSKGFVASMVNEADVVSLARQSLRDELVKLIPLGQRQLVTYLDQALPSIDPWLKQQIDIATGPAIDYLVGDSPTLRVVVSLDPMKITLKSSVRQAFLQSPPRELAGMTPAQLEVFFNQNYDQLAAQIPTTAVVDPATLGVGQPVSMSGAIADAEDVLAQARTAIGYIRAYYILLIVVTLLLISGIVLIHREVKGASRDLGITFLSYGALEVVGLLIGARADVSGMPAAIQTWLPGLYWAVSRPLLVFSIVAAIVGLALLVFSFLYRPRTVA